MTLNYYASIYVFTLLDLIKFGSFFEKLNVSDNLTRGECFKKEINRT
jgi:hypothetical protein